VEVGNDRIVPTPGRLAFSDNEAECTTPEHRAMQKVFHLLCAICKDVKSPKLYTLSREKYERALLSKLNRPGPAFYRSLKLFFDKSVMIQNNIIEACVLGISSDEFEILCVEDYFKVNVLQGMSGVDFVQCKVAAHPRDALQEWELVVMDGPSAGETMSMPWEQWKYVCVGGALWDSRSRLLHYRYGIWRCMAIPFALTDDG
jgi:hypothetical protein